MPSSAHLVMSIAKADTVVSQPGGTEPTRDLGHHSAAPDALLEPALHHYPVLQEPKR